MTVSIAASLTVFITMRTRQYSRRCELAASELAARTIARSVILTTYSLAPIAKNALARAIISVPAAEGSMIKEFRDYSALCQYNATHGLCPICGTKNTGFILCDKHHAIIRKAIGNKDGTGAGLAAYCEETNKLIRQLNKGTCAECLGECANEDYLCSSCRAIL